MRVVLVNPPLTTEERYGVHFQSGGQTPPLGLAVLAATMTKSGIDVRIVDGTLFNNYRFVVESILSSKPDCVGITASTVSIHNAARIAQLVKAENKSITMLIGGPHITAVPQKTMLLFSSFDIGVIGEADNTIVELLNSIEHRSSLFDVRGIAFRNNNRIVQTDRRPPFMNLDELPMPAWDLLPDLAKHYCPPVHTVRRLPATLMVTSRGCPGKCTFCDRSIFGNLLRANSAGYVMEEIRVLYHKYGIRELQFRDDNFLAFRPRLVELCRMLRHEKLDIVWSLAGRVDMVNPGVLRMLHDAGCWQIWYGVESGSQRVLDFINKRTKLDRIRETVRMTKAAGIDVGGFFMLGMPTETKEDIEATIRFSRALELDEAHFTFFTPMPGCAAYDGVEQYGKFDSDWRKTSCWNPVFVPNGMTSEQLVKYWKKASAGFYMRPRIVLNYIRKIRSLKHIRVYLSGVLALIEAVFVKRYATR